MNIDTLTDFFKWMTIINIALLLFSTFAVVVVKSWMVSIHSKLFGLSESKISEISYAYLGLYKALIIVFNIVPYCALLILN